MELPDVLCGSVFAHRRSVTNEEILRGDDYIEVTLTCDRCGDTITQIHEYNAFIEPAAATGD